MAAIQAKPLVGSVVQHGAMREMPAVSAISWVVVRA